ncbi:hypothetical protein [Paenibacillus sp. HB172176]|uniref:hypothetical protein n=1 Tax=Paenibacillus sp. HB172176 TaxID=2493690 RepID=UPI001439FFD9|nr:hypothetical protein [Paenibacillus sp. HB172176]
MTKKTECKQARADFGARRLLLLIDAISGHLKKTVILLLVLLLISQMLLQADSFRHWLTSANRWEGTLLN